MNSTDNVLEKINQTAKIEVKRSFYHQGGDLCVSISHSGSAAAIIYVYSYIYGKRVHAFQSALTPGKPNEWQSDRIERNLQPDLYWVTVKVTQSAPFYISGVQFCEKGKVMRIKLVC
jgi:hypothetical protein